MSAQQRLGILGGGQLGQMLLETQSARAMNATILCQNATDPAAQTALKLGFNCLYGGTDDAAALSQLCQASDIAIFESEFVDCDLLAQAQAATSVEFVPSLEVMRLFQNKLRQKELLATLDLPSARYIKLPSEAKAAQQVLSNSFPSGAMLKWAWRGYDGKGNLRLSAAEFSSPAVSTFMQAAAQQGSDVYAEELIPFRRELAMIGCLSRKGEFKNYPLVVSQQRAGICLWVRGPANCFGLSTQLEREIAAMIERLMRASDLVGSAGFELFELKDGSILFNEIAPRVHNSGHYTQDGADVSQFENHLRAVVGEPLGSTRAKGVFGMYNLLGPEGLSLQSASAPLPLVKPGMVLHWYGKHAIRPGRKLGHVNLTADSLNQLERAAIELEKNEAEWHDRLRSI